MTPDQQREQLLRWIDQSKRTQRILGIVIGALVLVSVGLLVWRKEVGGITLAIAVLTGIAGFWITGGHIIEFRARLRDVGKPKIVRVIGGGRRF